jgi:hypothetical protein
VDLYRLSAEAMFLVSCGSTATGRRSGSISCPAAWFLWEPCSLLFGFSATTVGCKFHSATPLSTAHSCPTTHRQSDRTNRADPWPHILLAAFLTTGMRVIEELWHGWFCAANNTIICS